jgi:citrate lyase beta subunit
MTFSDRSMRRWEERLGRVASEVSASFPGERPERQPVHTVYGGAQLFRSDTITRLGSLALESMRTWLPGPADLSGATGMRPSLAGVVHPLVEEKLDREAVEDFRIDFEDGYGNRSDEEEDGHARSTAVAVADALEAGTLSPFIGIRVKSLSGEMHRRALRTLDLFVTTLVEKAGRLPDGFRVTLPKIQHVEQVELCAEALAELESALGIGTVALELMVETPQTVIDVDGRSGLRRFVEAAGGRVTGAHFGTYDYTASMSITAAYQTMDHRACDFAKHILQVSLAGTGIWLSDGATNVMPLPVHRGEGLGDEQVEENRRTVHDAMRLHYGHVRHSLVHGFYQGWDLHPGQLATRYAAVYSFFLEGLDHAGSRLSNFIEAAARATLVGDVFDDAATGQGLLNYFLRAINCGAITPKEATARTGLTVEELETRSFLRILEARRGWLPGAPDT